MTYIFLSHSSKDNELTRFLADELIRAGFDVWVDFESIRSGDLWLRSIEQAVRGCSVFVIVLSKASRDSEWCERETLLAMDLKKPLQIAMIEDMPLPLHLINRQFTDFRADHKQGVKKLVSALRRDLKKLAEAEETGKTPQQPKLLSPEPDKDNFFKYMEQLPGEESNALIARDLYRWAKTCADSVEFGGKITPGFHAKVRVSDGEVTVMSVWAYPRQPAAQVQFQYFMPYPPYDNLAMRRSTLQSLRKLSEDGFLDEQADRRPTLAFNTALNTAEKLETFKQIMEEIMNNLRSG